MKTLSRIKFSLPFLLLASLSWGGVAKNITPLIFNDGTQLSSTATLASIPVSSLTVSGVTSGSYTNTNLTVDAQGRITSASNGSAGGTVNSGTIGQNAYYAANGTAVSGSSNMITNTSSNTFNVTTKHLFGLSSSTGDFSGAVNITGLTTTGGLTSNSVIQASLTNSATNVIQIIGFSGNPLTTLDIKNTAPSGLQETGYFGLQNDATGLSSGTYLVMGGNPSKVPAGNRNNYFLLNISTQSGQTGNVGITGTDVNFGLNTLSQHVGGNIFTMTASSTSANSTAEINLVATGSGTATIPTGFWQVGKSLKIKGAGFYSSTTTTPGNFTLKLKFGSTVILTTATVSYVVSQSTQIFGFSTTLTCRATGASGSIMGQTAFAVYDTTNGMRILPAINTTPVTLDMTANQSISFTWTDTVADPLNKKTLTNFTVDSQ